MNVREQGDALRRIECVQGDIVREEVDAIVNAASSHLRGGGGVDGAIHGAAGPGLLRELVERFPDGCPTGEVRVTGGHRLAARHVIHAVGPIWRGGGEGEAELLAACYRNALAAARELAIATISFPSVSTGAYGYPLEPAVRIALESLAAGLASAPRIERVRMVLFNAELLVLFEAELEHLRTGSQ